MHTQVATAHCAQAQGPRVKAHQPTTQLSFLARLTQDTRDLTTPIGAFLAALPQPPKRRAKTSSERGRAFRERQQRYEQELEEHVATLKREIAKLDLQRRARETRCLNRRTGVTGSLVQTIREYHRLFVHGLMELPSQPSRVGTKRYLIDESLVRQIRHQEEFIRHVIHPDAIVGSLVGPEASIVQWRRYTQSHATMTACVTGTDVILTAGHHDEDIVTVVARCALRVRFSRETFKMMFPHLLANESFLQRLIGKEVTYDTVKRFQFSSDGRIVTESVDVDFVGGLMNAGCSLDDITTLMGGAAITPDSMIVEVDEEPETVELSCEELAAGGEEPRAPSLPDSQQGSLDDYGVSYSPTTEPATHSRLSMAFLLAEATEPRPSTSEPSQATALR